MWKLSLFIIASVMAGSAGFAQTSGPTPEQNRTVEQDYAMVIDLQLPPELCWLQPDEFDAEQDYIENRKKTVASMDGLQLLAFDCASLAQWRDTGEFVEPVAQLMQRRFQRETPLSADVDAALEQLKQEDDADWGGNANTGPLAFMMEYWPDEPSPFGMEVVRESSTGGGAVGYMTAVSLDFMHQETPNVLIASVVFGAMTPSHYRVDLVVRGSHFHLAELPLMLMEIVREWRVGSQK